MSSTIFDDRSPFITYSPPDAWRQKVGKPQEFNQTTSGCNTPGANATLIFNGTSITVFGTVPSDDQDTLNHHTPPPISLYSIDNGPQTTFQPILFQSTAQMNTSFFQASRLAPNVSHTLVITIQSKGSLFLDYIKVDSDSSLAAAISPDPENVSRPSTSSMPETKPSSSPEPGHEQDSGHEQDGNPGVSLDGIIAVILGILSFVILLCVIFFFLGKKKRAHKLRQQEQEREEKMMASTESSISDMQFRGYASPRILEEGYPAERQTKSGASWISALWPRPQTEVAEAETRSVASGPVFYAR